MVINSHRVRASVSTFNVTEPSLTRPLRPCAPRVELMPLHIIGEMTLLTESFDVIRSAALLSGLFLAPADVAGGIQMGNCQYYP